MFALCLGGTTYELALQKIIMINDYCITALYALLVINIYIYN